MCAHSSDRSSSEKGKVPVIVVKEVSKTFRIRDGRGSLLIPSAAKSVRSLVDANFIAYEGDFVGIIGENGSGKSTFINLIAGNEAPSTGDILVRNQPVLLGISAALKPQLTGRDNVALGLLAMGASEDFVAEEMPRIITLSGIGSAIDRPMDTYSAGMGARLRFAIATAVQPEILLIDEALSAGDAAFAQRAKRRMDELLERAGAVLLVTHATDVINSMCNRALWIHQSRIIAEGAPETITSAYRQWAELASAERAEEAEEFIAETELIYKKPKIVLK